MNVARRSGAGGRNVERKVDGLVRRIGRRAGAGAADRERTAARVASAFPDTPFTYASDGPDPSSPMVIVWITGVASSVTTRVVFGWIRC
jgi:hypothetical protein